MLKRKAIYLLMLGAGIFCLAPLNAETKAQQDTTGFKRYTLEPIRVIARRPQEALSTLSTVNLTTDVPKVASNLKAALEDNPGLTVTVGTKDESNLRLRGFRKNEVRILVDGRPLNAGYFGNVDLQNLPLAEISEIQILKGPASSLYGSNTMGGVINIITKEPSRSQWLKIGLLAKRNNTNQAEVSLAHSFSESNFRIYAAREHTDGFVLPADFRPTAWENGAVRNHNQKTQYNFQGEYNFTVDGLHTLGLTAGVTTIDRKEIPSSIYEPSQYRLYKDWLRYQSTVMGEFILSEDAQLNSFLYFDGGQDTYQEYNDPEYQHLYINSEMRYSTFGFNPRLDWTPLDKLKLQTGYRWENQFSTRKDNGNYLDWTSHDFNLHNLFLQAGYQAKENLDLTASLGESIATGDLKDKPTGYAEPALGVYYTLADYTLLSLASGVNTAYPTLRQLYSAEKGNPNLKPQSALKTEASVNHPFTWKDLGGSISLSTYYNIVRNLIDLKDGKYDNIYQVNSYGLESGFLLQPFARLDFDFGYAFLSYSHSGDYRLTETPRNSLDLKANFTLPLQIKLTYNSLYRDCRLSQDENYNYKVLPSYWTHTLMVYKSFGRFSVKGGLENIFDTYYEEEYGYPAPGRNFSVKLEAAI